MKNSFFQKLKKGMKLNETPKEEKGEIKNSEIEEISIDLEEEKPAASLSKLKKSNKSIKSKPKKMPKKKIEIKTEKVEPEETQKTEKEEKWLEAEGQLAVDVYQVESELVIQSAIAGVKPEDLDISIENDLLTIKGERKRPTEEEGDYFSQECYWGHFSRQIILPVEVDPGRVEATLKEGVLTIRIPKIIREKKRKIEVKEI